MRSLRIVIPGLPPSQIFNLILLFPLLEDLAVIIHSWTWAENEEGGIPTVAQRHRKR